MPNESHFLNRKICESWNVRLSGTLGDECLHERDRCLPRDGDFTPRDVDSIDNLYPERRIRVVPDRNCRVCRNIANLIWDVGTCATFNSI